MCGISSIGEGRVGEGTPESLVQSQGLLPGQDNSRHSVPDRLPRCLPGHCLPHDQSTDGY